MKIRRAYKKTICTGKETATELYEALVGTNIGYLLESYDKNYDRYTFLGGKPEAIITAGEQELRIQKSDGQTEVRRGNPFTLLKEYYDEFQIQKGDGDFPFTGGFVGSLAYDFVRFVEKLPDENPDELGIGPIQLMLITSFYVLDYRAETISGVVLEEDTPDGKERAQCQLEEMLEQVREVSEQASKGKAKITTEKERKSLTGVIRKKTDSLEDYSRKVEKIKEYIREGHIFQTVLSQRWTIETKESGFALYKKLREQNPSPYLYYFRFPDFELIGSSPEMIVKQREQRVYTCPIAGTRPRGKTEAEDLALEKELLADEKERAEHVMLVDLARNDMGRIAEFGTVKVTQFMRVQRYSQVMHLVSEVEGRKKGSHHPLDLLASFLPAGTLSGAPKIRAMEIIDELEEVKRGLYGGATGYLDFSGEMDFCITIRSMVKKGNLVYLQAGAGIVADSVPKKEYEECCNKVRALAKTLVEETAL